MIFDEPTGLLSNSMRVISGSGGTGSSFASAISACSTNHTDHCSKSSRCIPIVFRSKVTCVSSYLLLLTVVCSWYRWGSLLPSLFQYPCFAFSEHTKAFVSLVPNTVSQCLSTSCCSKGCDTVLLLCSGGKASRCPWVYPNLLVVVEVKSYHCWVNPLIVRAQLFSPS